MGLDQTIVDEDENELIYLRKNYALQDCVFNNCELVKGDVPYEAVHAITIKNMVEAIVHMLSDTVDSIRFIDELEEHLTDKLREEYIKPIGDMTASLRDLWGDINDAKRMVESLNQMIEHNNSKYYIYHSW